MHDPQADGNCFFHCCIYFLKKYKANHHNYTAKTLREKVFTKARNETTQWQAFIDESPDEYLEKMIQTGEWVDHIGIQLTANLLRRKIIIITTEAQNRTVHIDPSAGECHVRAIFLGHLNNEHYITLKPLPHSKYHYPQFTE